jgi:hypothetical protein
MHDETTRKKHRTFERNAQNVITITVRNGKLCCSRRIGNKRRKFMTSKTISSVAGPGKLLVSDAENAINQKAVELGPARTGGSSVSLLETAGTGFRKRYRGCDIYYSEATGAHEVHGAIREKYKLLGEANGSLGLPTSDEQDAQDAEALGDQKGRFGKFEHGAVYWSPRTGPRAIYRTDHLARWASTGGEMGPLGYPVADTHAYRSNGFNSLPVFWTLFENGAVFSSEDDVELVVDIS